MSDVSIQQDVMDELDFEPRVHAAHIGVAVDNGVVTLSGHVGSYAEKLAVEKAARRVRGVKAIAEEVKVRFPSDQKTNDDEIAQRAMNILLWSSVLPQGSVSIKVQDGWVGLSGQVAWQYQRSFAESQVRRLSGVIGVINSITIKPLLQPADVKRKIEDALKRHAEVEAQGIRVKVNAGGTVTLEGAVHDWQEREAVKNAAWSAPGVKHVEDRLLIS